MMSTAEQKIRDLLAENAWRFQHEGANVVRWLTGGTDASAYVTFGQQGDKIVAYCPKCLEALGDFDTGYSSAVYRQIAAIREVSSRHHCQF